MSLQTARYLVKATELSRNGQALAGNIAYLNGAFDSLAHDGARPHACDGCGRRAQLTHLLREPYECGAMRMVAACNVKSADDWLVPENQLAAFRHRAARIIYAASDAYYSQLKAGVEGTPRSGRARACARHPSTHHRAAHACPYISRSRGGVEQQRHRAGARLQGALLLHPPLQLC